MTVCIGAMCKGEREEERCIVLCCDTRVGVHSLGSTDMGTKFDVICPGILAAMAGSVPRAQELILRYRQHLGPEPLTSLDALDRVRYPAHRQKTVMVDEYLRTRWSVTREEYLGGVLGQLPESERARIAREIESITLQASLLIATFVDGNPFLAAVHEDGTVQVEEDFAVIGSGYTTAFPALCQRRCYRWMPLPQALYFVYEAKRLSEIEPSVGPETEIYILSNTRKIQCVTKAHGLTTLSDLFKEFGPRSVPPDLQLSPGTIFQSE